jgi:hypothetical protein
MTPNDMNRQAELEMEIIAYRLGHLSDDDARRFAQRLADDAELRRIADELSDPLDALDSYNIYIPKDLHARVMSAVRTSRLLKLHTDDADLTDASGRTPRRRAFAGILHALKELSVAAAAVILITSLWTVTAREARDNSYRAMCAANLGSVGTAIARYYNDHPNQLPMARLASADRWLDPQTGQPRRPHLYLLVKHGYTEPKILVCPAAYVKCVSCCPSSQLRQYSDFTATVPVTYSFQNLFGDNRFTPRQLTRRWENAADMAIMADRTPLIADTGLSQDFTPQSTSPNHLSLIFRGQNVLFLDGRAAWQRSPVIDRSHDNIWQIGQLSNYTGTEVPEDPTDVFLAP